MSHSDRTPKPDHWTVKQERAYQALAAQQEGTASGSAEPSRALLPPPPRSMASPDGKWLWDGERWVPAPSKSVSIGALIALVVGICLVAGAIWAVVNENERQDEMRRDLERINCESYGFC